MFDPLPAVKAVLRELGTDAWLVGGRVRDILLKRPTVDTDVVVRSDPLAVARRVATDHGGAFVPLDEERGVGRVVWPGDVEGAPPRGVLDLTALMGGSLATDLRSRDFTINALAVALDRLRIGPSPTSLDGPLEVAFERHDIVDYTGGMADLAARWIRATHATALEEDPLRMVRAVRIAAELSFELEPSTRRAIALRADRLSEAAAERRREEVVRLLAVAEPAPHVPTLIDLGLWIRLFPQCIEPLGDPGALRRIMAGVEGVSRASRRTVDTDVGPALSGVGLLVGRHRERLGEWLRSGPTGGHVRGRWVRLAALMSECPDVLTSTTRALRLGGREAQLITHAVEGARSLEAPDQAGLSARASKSGRRRAVFRFFDRLGEGGVAAALLATARCRHRPAAAQAAITHAADTVLEAWFERREELVDPPTLLDGAELMAALDLGPGPRVGMALRAIREAQAAGEVSDRAGAIALARRVVNAESEQGT